MTESGDPALLRVLYGTDERPPDRLALRAGPLTATLVDGGLRRLAWNDVEIVRAIAFLIRDDAWGTMPARLDPPTVAADAAGFRVGWTGSIGADAGRFTFRAVMEGHRDGRFAFAVDGAPDADILTNRAGFVLLHPADFAGRPVTLLAVDGTEADARFPLAISPGQPFLDLRGLRYALPGVGTVTCRMEASLPEDPLGRFETEDQRNWCDASFKTYVGSLLDPWPYRLPAGVGFRQRVSVEIGGDDGPPREPAGATAGMAGDGPRRLPAFGIGLPHRDPPPAPALASARDLAMPWVVVELDLRRADGVAHLAAAAAFAANAAVRLDVIAPGVVRPADEIGTAAALCRQAGLSPQAVLVLPAPLLKSYQPGGPWPDLPPLEDWYAAARAAFPAAAVGGGMMTNFTELNRKRPSPAGLAFVAHATTAIVHDAADDAVMETLETLPHIAHSVRALWPGVPWHLGPSSIAMRSNPYGANDPQNPAWLRMPLADRDPRQRGLYGAAWTVGFAAAVAGQEAALVALHATHGPLGLEDGEGLFPCFHVMAALSRASGRAWRPVATAPGLAALGWETETGPEGLIANLTPCPVSLPPLGPGRVLDAVSVAGARHDHAWSRGPAGALPDRLPPYAVAFLRD